MVVSKCQNLQLLNNKVLNLQCQVKMRKVSVSSVKFKGGGNLSTPLENFKPLYFKVILQCQNLLH